MRKWKEADPEDRERDFLPQKFNSLREVPAYPRFIRERFERCLDLYLCPRQLKMRVSGTPLVRTLSLDMFTHHMHSTHTHTCTLTPPTPHSRLHVTHTEHDHTPHTHPVCLPFQVHIDDPNVLLPKLPKPKDLQPFPVSEAIVSDTHME